MTAITRAPQSLGERLCFSLRGAMNAKGMIWEKGHIAGDISGSELTSSEGQKGEVLSMKLSLKVEKNHQGSWNE